MRPPPRAPVACAHCARGAAVVVRPRTRLIALAAAPRPPAAAADNHDASAPSTPLLRASLSLLAFYKAGISPLLPKSCRFLPTCSEYATTAYTRFGVGRGFLLTAARLARCHPFSGSSGYDPVPKEWPPEGWGWLVRK